MHNEYCDNTLRCQLNLAQDDAHTYVSDGSNEMAVHSHQHLYNIVACDLHDCHGKLSKQMWQWLSANTAVNWQPERTAQQSAACIVGCSRRPSTLEMCKGFPFLQKNPLYLTLPSLHVYGSKRADVACQVSKWRMDSRTYCICCGTGLPWNT